MRKTRKIAVFIILMLFIVMVITDGIAKNISSILLILLILFVFGIYPFLIKIIYSKNPRVKGIVRSIENSRFTNRKTAIVEFEYNGLMHEVKETYNVEDLPNIDSELTVIIDAKRISNSLIDESENANVIFNIIITIMAIAIILLKIFKVV